MRTRPPLLGLRHVALNVRDLPAMKRFYVEVLGFRVEWEPDAENVYLTSGTDNLALHQAAPASPLVPPKLASKGGEPRSGEGGHDAPVNPLDHLGLVVAAKADVDAWAAYLQERGLRAEGPPRTHRDGARSLYLTDPENNRVQIIYHPPISDHG